MTAILHTPRLRLEPYDDRHFEGLLALNSNPSVMRYIGDGTTDTAADVREDIVNVKARWIQLGFSWWAFLSAETGKVLGAGCIQHLENDMAQPLELGWRLRPDQWGRGFATEAARAMVAFAFGTLDIPCLYAVAHPQNGASIRVMQRLGMRNLGLEQHYSVPCATYILERSATPEGLVNL